VQSAHAIAAADCLIPTNCIHPPAIEHANELSLISIEYNIGTMRLIFRMPQLILQSLHERAAALSHRMTKAAGACKLAHSVLFRHRS
jgi:hypothetical protein